MDQTPHLATEKGLFKEKWKSKEDDILRSPVIDKKFNQLLDPASTRKAGTDSADEEPGENQNRSAGQTKRIGEEIQDENNTKALQPYSEL